jgi:hypothetical protein
MVTMNEERVTNQLPKQLKLIVLVNALIIALYLYWNWTEYSILKPLYHVAITTNFPWYIQFSGTPDGNAIIVFIDINFGLMMLLLAIFTNMYFIITLQRNNQTK